MAKDVDQFPTGKSFVEAIDKALKEVAEKEVRSLRRSVEDWKEPVSFNIEKASAKNAISYSITTNSKKWIWVNFGTKPRKIYAKNAPYLYFPTEYNPKTRKGRITGTGGTGKNWSGPWTRRPFVNHPGIEPRRFDKNLEPKRAKRLQDSLNKYLKDVF